MFELERFVTELTTGGQFASQPDANDFIKSLSNPTFYDIAADAMPILSKGAEFWNLNTTPDFTMFPGDDTREARTFYNQVRERMDTAGLMRNMNNAPGSGRHRSYLDGHSVSTTAKTLSACTPSHHPDQAPAARQRQTLSTKKDPVESLSDVFTFFLSDNFHMTDAEMQTEGVAETVQVIRKYKDKTTDVVLPQEVDQYLDIWAATVPGQGRVYMWNTSHASVIEDRATSVSPQPIVDSIFPKLSQIGCIRTSIRGRTLQRRSLCYCHSGHRTPTTSPFGLTLVPE